jgi:hypothetical protein
MNKYYQYWLYVLIVFTSSRAWTGDFDNVVDLRLSRQQRCEKLMQERAERGGEASSSVSVPQLVNFRERLAQMGLSPRDLPDMVPLLPMLQSLGLDPGGVERIPASRFTGFSDSREDGPAPDVAVTPVYPLRGLAASERPQFFAAKINKDNLYDSPMLGALVRSIVIFQISPQGDAHIVTRLDAPRLIDSLENPQFILNSKILRVSVHERGDMISRWLLSNHVVNATLKPAYDVFFYDLSARTGLRDAPKKLSKIVGMNFYRVRQLSPLTYFAVAAEAPYDLWFLFYNPITGTSYKYPIYESSTISSLLLKTRGPKAEINTEMLSATEGQMRLGNGDLFSFDRHRMIDEPVKKLSETQEQFAMPGGFSYVETALGLGEKDKKLRSEFDIRILSPSGTKLWSFEGASAVYGVRGQLHRLAVEVENQLFLVDTAAQRQILSWNLPPSFRAKSLLIPVHGGFIANLKDGDLSRQMFLSDTSIVGAISDHPMYYSQVLPNYVVGADPVDAEYNVRLRLAPLPEEEFVQ